MATGWSDLSPRTRKLIIVTGVTETGLKVAAAIDLKRRAAGQVRGPKWAWFAGLLVNSAGLIPLSYFLFGRRGDAAAPGPAEALQVQVLPGAANVG